MTNDTPGTDFGHGLDLGLVSIMSDPIKTRDGP